MTRCSALLVGHVAQDWNGGERTLNPISFFSNSHTIRKTTSLYSQTARRGKQAVFCNRLSTEQDPLAGQAVPGGPGGAEQQASSAGAGPAVGNAHFSTGREKKVAWGSWPLHPRMHRLLIEPDRQRLRWVSDSISLEGQVPPGTWAGSRSLGQMALPYPMFADAMRDHHFSANRGESLGGRDPVS